MGKKEQGKKRSHQGWKNGFIVFVPATSVLINNTIVFILYLSIAGMWYEENTKNPSTVRLNTIRFIYTIVLPHCSAILRELNNGFTHPKRI